MKEKKHKPEADQFWKLVTLELDSRATEKDRSDLNRLLAENHLFLEKYFYLKNNWEKVCELAIFPHIDIDNDWLLVKRRIESMNAPSDRRLYLHRTPMMQFVWRAMPYAAIFLLVIALGAIVLNPSPHLPNIASFATTIEAPLASKVYLQLPDGSKAWLNAGSKLQYNSGFGITNRDVHLDGEGYFQVDESALPFIVRIEQVRMTALGTSFNIRAFPSDPKLRCALLEGRIRVDFDGDVHPNVEENGDEIILYPGQQIAVERGVEGEAYTYRIEYMDDIASEALWTEGVIVINNETLGDLAIRLERQYDVNIVFTSDEAKNYIYSGRLRQLSLEQILRALELTSPIAFEIDERTVYVSINPEAWPKYVF